MGDSATDAPPPVRTRRTPARPLVRAILLLWWAFVVYLAYGIARQLGSRAALPLLHALPALLAWYRDQMLFFQGVLALLAAAFLGFIGWVTFLAWRTKAAQDEAQSLVRVDESRQGAAIALREDPKLAEISEQVEDLAKLMHGEVEPATVVSTPPFDILPVPDHFVGREEDIGWLMDRLRPQATPSVVSLNGLGGIGKSAVAAVVLKRIQSERRFPDGIALVDCREETDGIKVLRRVLARFEAGRRQPAITELDKLGDIVKKLLGGKRALVVLDNIESGLAPNLALMVALLREAGIMIFLLSREVLPLAVVPIEASRQLKTLTTDQALELFAQSMGHPTLRHLTEIERIAAGRIVAALGNHPLAVKLAGGYAAEQQRELTRLADELEANPQRALILRNGQEAVNAVLASSYTALPTHTQRVFAALAAFAATDVGRNAAVTIAKALSISDQEESVERLVRLRLVDASVNGHMPDGSDRERLRLHLLVRAFSSKVFSEWPEAEQAQVRDALVKYFVAYAAEPDKMGDATRESILRADEANIAGAIEWAAKHKENGLAALLCSGTQYFWYEGTGTSNGLYYLELGEHAAWTRFSITHSDQDRRRATRLSRTFNAALLRPPIGFVPRPMEVEWVMSQLRSGSGVALVSVVGMGGIGKTVVAGAVLRQVLMEDLFRDGIAVIRGVEFRRADEEGVLIPMLHRFDPLGVRFGAIHPDSLPLVLKGQDVLVVLDDVAFDSRMLHIIARLHESGIAVLITGRVEPSGTPAELLAHTHVLSLNTLSLEDALSFLDRSLLRYRGSGLRPDELDDATELVGLFGGHPLAIDIAAAVAARRGSLRTVIDELLKSRAT